MSSDIVIRVENLSKKYTLGQKRSGIDSGLRHALQSAATAPWRMWKNRKQKTENGNGSSSAFNSQLSDSTPSATQLSNLNSQHSDPAFWALKDVSFEVRRGEVLGIIGRNGAGKSTLLKILSRITEPTSGRIGIKGRVASLLEVGTGFHPELTGRENVYLNGAILGMSRVEVKQKFDEIVAFAEVEKFLDSPVKRYSSGMYVRLAFAVAAHLEPDILIIDEVLAVGDAEFQKKCLGKMQNVSGEGRTVLFVSHNMQAVRTLCPRSLLLVNGHSKMNGPTNEVASRYLESTPSQEIDGLTAVNDARLRRGSGEARFVSISIEDITGQKRFCFSMGETIRFRLAFEVFKLVDSLAVSICVRGGSANEFVTTHWCEVSKVPLPASTRDEVVIEFPNANLRPGEYPLYLWLGAICRRPFFDVIDGLTSPLVITTSQTTEELGFEPSHPAGFFSIEGKLLSRR